MNDIKTARTTNFKSGEIIRNLIAKTFFIMLNTILSVYLFHNSFPAYPALL